MNNKNTILVVEDTHDSLELLVDLLETEGYEVRPADSGELALASVAASPPALILLDIRMPGIDGFEVFRQLKAHSQNQNIPVIFLSAIIETEQRLEGLKMGAVDFISKPYQREELLARVQTQFELSQLRARLEELVAERTHELNEVQEQLLRQERLAGLGEMAGSVGHELRQPLSVISNAVYFLNLIQPEADVKIKEYLNIIKTETLASEKIVNDLLNFTRILSSEREPVSISKLVQRVLARYPAPESVTVSLNFPESLPKVYVDPLQLEQVLSNLVINACQAMSSTSPVEMPKSGELTLSASTQDEMIKLVVQDTGSGISSEDMRKLFEPLFTTKIKGIGLGLAVSKKLAEANGGHIEVQSEAGKGSTFTLYLPAIGSEK